MKKVLLLVLVSMILLFVFTSCDKLPASITSKLDAVMDKVGDVKLDAEIALGLHEHAWADATCEAPKTCTVCGATEGAALGHSWTAANCETPKTCSTCKTTEGEALGHDWENATCYDPKTCKVCKKQQGIALVHNWVEATCTEPETCYRCGLTEGEALGHTWADATCWDPKTCTTCGATEGTTLEHVIVEADCTTPMHCELCGATNGAPLGHEYLYECDGWCSRCYEFTNPEAAHKLTHVEAKAATCFEAGNVEYWTCEYCGGCWDNDQATGMPLNAMMVKVPAQHTLLVHMDAVEPGCHMIGNVEYWICYACELVWTDADLTQQSNVKNVIIPATGDGLLVEIPAVEPGCHYNGCIQHWICYTCEQVWQDEALTQLTNTKNVILPATREVDAIHVPAANGTCAKPGNVEYWYCEQCMQVWTDEALTQLTNMMSVRTDFDFTTHALVCEIGDGAATYTCTVCEKSFVVDNGAFFTGEGNFTYNSNGKMPISNANGVYEAIFAPTTDMPASSEGLAPGAVVGEWAWNTPGFGAQHMFWIPSNQAGKGVQGFSCANNAVGFVSFKMQTNVTYAFDVALAKERGAADWSGWGTSQLVYLNIGGYSEEGIVIKAFGTPIATIPVADGWSEWFQVDVLVELKSDNTYTMNYYVNGEHCLTAANRTMNIDTGDIRALYISGWTYAAQTGLRLDDVVFAYTTDGHNVFDGNAHQEATCTEGVECTCGYTAPALGHDEKFVCFEGTVCTRCDELLAASAGHNLVVEGNTVSCTGCGNSYTIDNGKVFDGEADFYYTKNGNMPLTKNDGIYEAIFAPTTPMPESSEGLTPGATVGEWAWNTPGFGAQHMFWIPTNVGGKGVQGFSCANNSVGLISFKMQTNVTAAFNISLAKERGASDWSGWGTSETKFISIGGYSENGIVLKAEGGAVLANIPVVDGWSEWFQVDVLVQLKSDNTFTFEYYVNGNYCATVSKAMNIDTGDFRALYINGWTYATQTGIRLDDVVFGSDTGAHYIFDGAEHNVTEGEYFDYCSCGWSSSAVASEALAAEDVTSETLKTIVESKYKQWDQCTEVNKQGGTSAYVLAEKDGELVEALYCSRTYAWDGTESEQFSEYRFAVNGEKAGPAATSISFDYKIVGSVEKNERYIFTDLKGENFTSDAYVQVKTPSNHPLAGDNYPELSGTDLILDGEWHTMTYTFDEPLVIVDILLNLYHFQGEFILSNLVITYAE